ncbi:MAG: phosphoribosylglycinamide formyltransferase [Hyphomicrobiales bacterium]|nr:phosphoribosylglycinamide formyltransferase [Rickettsiales bacterium]MCP5361984.1 phosphoribosylglycinamide formyltransferase [Hyphomicrobiales bacterium]
MGVKTAVLISGRGSNLKALIDAAQGNPGYPAEIACVISNKPDAPGLFMARKAGIHAIGLNHRDYKDRKAFEDAIQALLEKYECELVVLAGFMRLLTPEFTARWYGKMINIHPSLLPSFKGAYAHRDALASGVCISGCTVHFVSPEMDAGPIILQAAVPVLEEDTESSLAARVLVQEHRCLPYALKLLAEGRLHIKGMKVEINPATVHTAPPALLNPPLEME